VIHIVENIVGTLENRIELEKIEKEVEARKLGKKGVKKVKKEQKTHKTNFKTKILTILVTGVMTIGVLGTTGTKLAMSIKNFNNTMEIKSQPLDIDIQWPGIWAEPKEPEYVAVSNGIILASNNTVLTEAEKVNIISKSDYPKIIAGIRMLESSNNSRRDQTAHHVDCQKVGMTNEFGFRALDNYCFSTFEEAVKTVNDWLDTNLVKYNLNQALCRYATGQATDVCEYSKNFHALDKQGKLASN